MLYCCGYIFKGANCFDMKALLSFCVKSLAARLSGKSYAKELRGLLGLVDNLSPDVSKLTNMIPVEVICCHVICLNINKKI